MHPSVMLTDLTLSGSELYSEFNSKGIGGRLVNPVEGSLMVPPGVSLWELS